jgi:hypothetical protein
VTDPSLHVPIDYRIITNSDGSWYYEWRYADDPDTWIPEGTPNKPGPKPDDPVQDQPVTGGGSGGGQPASPTQPPTAAKSQAARSAVTANYVASVLTGATAVAGAVTLKAPNVWTGGATLILGIATGAAWGLATYYQSLANDPPRDDFAKVSLLQRYSVALPAEATDPTGIWHDFVEGSVLTAVAVGMLTKSYERAGGVAAALAKGATDELNGHMVRQSDAIRGNARACADLIAGLLAQQDAVNRVWADLSGALDAQLAGGDAPTPEDTGAAFAGLWAQIEP